MCIPYCHPYNEPIIQLYGACGDQLIIGPSGAVSLNDIAIGHAMQYYFDVQKEERLRLSQSVRKFYSKILRVQKENADEG